MTSENAMTSLLSAWSQAVADTSLADLLATRGLPVAPVADRAVWDAVDPLTRAAVRERAEPELGAPWPQPLTSAYARYFRDGNRTDYEDQVRERQHRLSRAALMAAWTREQVWLDEVVDGVVLLCEQTSWSWAAHDDTMTRRGQVTPSPDHPYVDLGAGEVLAQLAWVDALLGPDLDERAPGVRSRIRREAQTRVFTPFRDRRDWHWLGLDGPVHNWNPWIHGHILTGALALLGPRGAGHDTGHDAGHDAGTPGPADAAPTQLEVVELVVQGLDRFVAALPADGAIDEGYSYWWNGAGRLLEALELLRHASDGRLDPTVLPAVVETVRFPHRMQVAGPWYVNVADGPARPTSDQPWHLLHRWGVLLDDPAVRDHAAAQRHLDRPLVHESSGLGRALRGLSDPGWRRATTTAPPLVADVWLPSVELLVARERAGSPEGLTLAVKGGHNGENHNHNDVGSFVVALDGVPVVVDAGQPTYTAQTFGPDRYAIWTMQSAWHNLPAPAVGRAAGLGDAGTPAAAAATGEQGVGAAFAARDVVVHRTPAGAALSMDLAGTYPLPGLTRWSRTVRLVRAGADGLGPEQQTTQETPAPGGVRAPGAVVEVEDSWELEGADVPAQATHLLLHGAVVEVGPGRVRVTPPRSSRALLVTWDPAHAVATTTRRDLDDPLLAGVWGDHLTRLELTSTPAAAVATARTTTGSLVLRMIAEPSPVPPTAPEVHP